MAQSQIRWKKQDYLTLGRAVANFNKKRNDLENEENKIYLPSTINYKDIKGQITTRNELKRVLRSLKAFNKESVLPISLESGEILTKWEYGELKKARTRIKRRLNKNYKELSIPREGEEYSRILMGSSEARTINARLENLEKLENLRGYEFNNLRNRIIHEGQTDYEMKKALVYKENIMNSLEELMQNFEEFKDIYDYFKNIKNPIDFVKVVQKSNAMQDIFEWYKKNGYGGFDSIKDIASYILNEYK